MIAEPSSSRSTFAAESAWPAERAERVDLREEARARALQRLERQRAGEVGRLREPARAHEAERAERGHELRAVDEREPLLRLQPDGLEPDARRAPPPPGRSSPSTDASPSPTSGSARCASGARSPLAPTEPRLGTCGQHAAVEALDQQLDRLDPRARVALRERVRAQQHRRAHDLVRVRLADAARVAAQQAELQLLGQLLGNRLRDEAAEAGVDAVRVLARAVRGALDELARRAIRSRAASASATGRAADGDLPDVLRPRSSPVSALLAITRRV